MEQPTRIQGIKIPMGRAVPELRQRKINHTIEKINAFEKKILY